jgi:hypothetical protein
MNLGKVVRVYVLEPIKIPVPSGRKVDVEEQKPQPLKKQ